MATWGVRNTGKWADRNTRMLVARGRLLQTARDVEQEAREIGDVSALSAAQNCIAAIERGGVPSSRDRAMIEMFNMANVA